MSISVNYILEKENEKKKKATQPLPEPLHPTSQDTGGTVPAGAIENRTANYLRNQTNNQQAQQAPAQPDIDYSKKPQGWSDDEYNAVRQIYNDDQIQQIYNQPDPESLLNGIFSSIYKKNTPAPVAQDEKTMKRQRNIAGIGDILGLISQAAAGSMGAINRTRTFEQSAMGQLAPKQQEVYDKYLKRTDDYGRGLINAQMQDYLKGMQDWKKTQENIAKSLNDYRKYQLDAAKQQQDAAYKRFQADNTAKRTEAYKKSLEEQAKDRARRTGIEEKRANAYIEKLRSPIKTSTGKADYQLVLPADPNDPDATQDQFGNKVRVFGMSNGEMDAYAREAMADENFKKEHPELFTSTFGQKLTADDKRNIAAIYLQDMYERGLQSPELDARISSENRFIGTPPEIIEEPVEQFNPETDSDLNEEFAIIY